MESEAPAKSAQQLHDEEVSSFNAWKNNPHTSSYTWAIEVNGAIVLREYDDCACASSGEYDAGGHLHKMSEWPAPPYVLHAEPKHLDHQSLPELSIEIEPGEEPIWGHRVRQLLAPDGRSKFEDVQLIGKKLVDGTEQILTSYPDGSVFDHASMDEAQAHSHPHIALFERPDVAPGEAPIRR